MAHNRRRNRLEDFEPEKQSEMLEAFWEVTEGNDLEAWFFEPWRDGRNAVRLLLSLDKGDGEAAENSPRWWLERAIDKDHSKLTSDDYARADDWRYEVSRTDASPYGVLLNAALAVYVNWIARSDGGGNVPNVHLSAAIGRLLYEEKLQYQAVLGAVGLWRSRDAGPSWARIGDGTEQGRRAAAHRWLWMNRRYQMAYVFARAL